MSYLGRSRFTLERATDPKRSQTRRTLVVGGGSWSDAYRSAGELLRAARSAPACCTDLNSLNRRMRTRMSGGVGGE